MEKSTNEMIDTLNYLIDKFNLTLEVPKEQLKQFSEQFVHKIIAWEIFNSILSILGAILVLYLIYRLYKRYAYNDKALYKLLVITGESITFDENGETSKDRGNEDKLALVKKFIKIITILCSIIPLVIIASNIVDLVLCLIFPEKIILEFISLYI